MPSQNWTTSLGTSSTTLPLPSTIDEDLGTPVSHTVSEIVEETLADTGETGGGGGAARRRVSLVRGDSIKPEPIRWLWDGWLAAGKLHILAGQPGTGKTTLALSLAAQITSGGHWPDGGSVETASVLIWSGEDDVRDTLLPRLLAMKADTSKVHFVDHVKVAGVVRSFDPASDLAALEREAAAVGGIRLLIIDPIVSAVAGDSHKNAETRRCLQPLVDFASRLDCVLLGITHLTKGTAGREPIERITGSLAFGAMARVVLIAAKLPAETGTTAAGRILMRAKSNIGDDSDGFCFDVEDVRLPDHPGVCASRITWCGPVAGSARELLARADPDLTMVRPNAHSQSMTEDAVDLLERVLEGTPMLSKTVSQLAIAAGISAKALRMARERLGVAIRRIGFGADTKTYWQLSSTYVPLITIPAAPNPVAEVVNDGTSVATVTSDEGEAPK